MNILFITTGKFESIEANGIYPDLLREFRKNGHTVYSVSSYEKRTGKSTELVEENGAYSLHVKIGNITKCGLIEKGISTLMIESQYLKAIKTHLKDVKFDLVLYSTPPITLVKVIKFIKKRDNAKSYLLLKDIFPQNAVDIGVMTKSGMKGLLYHYFRRKEKKLYLLSDYIGCMSEANVQYILRNNPEIAPERVEVCPNAVEVRDMSVDANARKQIREKYGIPTDKKIFVYGGNLGRPQGIPHLIKCLRAASNIENSFFLVVGDGTEYKKLEQFISESKLPNVMLMKRLPKEDYDRMVGACDVGMIFLDHRFTIPNFPSRLLAYMQAKLPVLACTDINTDVGEVCARGGFGVWCEANDAEAFANVAKDMLSKNLRDMGDNGFEYLCENYEARHAYDVIMNRIEEKETINI